MHRIFTEGNFARAMRAGDSRRFRVDLKARRQDVLDAALKEANVVSPAFMEVFSVQAKGRRCVSLKNYSQNLILRAASRYISRRFRVKPRSRENIVEEVIETLGDSTPMYILRKDIRAFYESVNIADVKRRLIYDTIIPSKLKGYLRAFFQKWSPSDLGLPRGVGLSSVLAELAMLPTDQRIREVDGVYKYFRFADDILIFSCLAPKELEQRLSKTLPDGLKFNAAKSFSLALNNADKTTATQVSFEYLGYKFEVSNSCGAKDPRKVSVQISERKIKKIKTRLICSLKSFAKSGDLGLLRDRIRFLASNYSVFRRGISAIKTSRRINSGIFYNYRLCGNYIGAKVEAPTLNDLKALDSFYHYLLTSRSSEFSKLFASPFGRRGLAQLQEISFHKGFTKRMMVRFKADRVQAIKRVWQNA